MLHNIKKEALVVLVSGGLNFEAISHYQIKNPRLSGFHREKIRTFQKNNFACLSARFSLMMKTLTPAPLRSRGTFPSVFISQLDPTSQVSHLAMTATNHVA